MRIDVAIVNIAIAISYCPDWSIVKNMDHVSE